MTTVPPYITAWTGEVGYRVRHAPIVGGPALFAATGARGEGSPIWGRISEERQRECAARRLCQVCHRPFRLHVEPGFSLVPLRDVCGVPSTHEPLCCRACLPGTLKLCPALCRMVAAGGLTPIAVTGYDLAVQQVGAVYPAPDDPGAQINAALELAGVDSAAGFVQLLLTSGAVLTVAQVFELAGVPIP